ncbi:hypothetical protein BMA2200 [Burkholderia mallei ATCC 23344]|uniref:Uncharacterized protein n=1 Tax=Burkholderia mallei (strain ATCC 23344) TaxID=243160 RepID=A0A0H2WL30_BURMA|nr:hypothetical protein BMA2200 [Burkholderia mallei ATCC 23344]
MKRIMSSLPSQTAYLANVALARTATAKPARRRRCRPSSRIGRERGRR